MEICVEICVEMENQQVNPPGKMRLLNAFGFRYKMIEVSMFIRWVLLNMNNIYGVVGLKTLTHTIPRSHAPSGNLT